MALFLQRILQRPLQMLRTMSKSTRLLFPSLACVLSYWDHGDPNDTHFSWRIWRHLSKTLSLYKWTLFLRMTTLLSGSGRTPRSSRSLENQSVITFYKSAVNFSTNKWFYFTALLDISLPNVYFKFCWWKFVFSLAAYFIFSFILLTFWMLVILCVIKG